MSAETAIVGPNFLKGSPAAEPNTRRPLVLLIEEHAAQLGLYAQLIDEEVSVIAATSGETGYSLACAEEPDVVMIDVRLPDVDGVSICQRLRANPDTASIPVIVFTRPCSTELLLATLRSTLGLNESA